VCFVLTIFSFVLSISCTTFASSVMLIKINKMLMKEICCQTVSWRSVTFSFQCNSQLPGGHNHWVVRDSKEMHSVVNSRHWPVLLKSNYIHIRSGVFIYPVRLVFSAIIVHHTAKPVKTLDKLKYLGISLLFCFNYLMLLPNLDLFKVLRFRISNIQASLARIAAFCSCMTALSIWWLPSQY